MAVSITQGGAHMNDAKVALELGQVKADVK